LRKCPETGGNGQDSDKSKRGQVCILCDTVPKQKSALKRCVRMRSVQLDIMTTIGKSPDGGSRYDKIKKWHKILTSSAFRKKYNIRIVDEIKRICFLMHLPQIAEDMAISIYRKARVAKITNGRRVELIASASVYASCRVSGFPRSLDEFATATRLQPKNIGRVYLVIKRTLHLPIDAVGPSTQVHRIALTAGVTPETEMLAVKMLENQKYGGKPTTLAATALYVAAVHKGSGITQTQLAKAAGIDVNTLRNCYQQYKFEMA
jgi:transcription initiation factor TFIIB